MTRYVVGFVFWGNRVLLIRKARPTWQAGKLNGIGGHIEPGETAREAMCREFVEETGWSVESWAHFATLIGNDNDGHRRGVNGGEFEITFFACYWPDDLIPPLSFPANDEPVNWWHDARGLLPDDVLPNLRWLVPLASYEHRQDWPLHVLERASNIE